MLSLHVVFVHVYCIVIFFLLKQLEQRLARVIRAELVLRSCNKMAGRLRETSLDHQPLHPWKVGLVVTFCAGSEFCDPPVAPMRLQNACKL